MVADNDAKFVTINVSTGEERTTRSKYILPVIALGDGLKLVTGGVYEGMPLAPLV
jgi:hypothetical protein